MGRFAQKVSYLEEQHKQVVFLPPAILEQVEEYKVTNEITSLSQACYELIKLGLGLGVTKTYKGVKATQPPKTPLEQSWCCSDCIYLSLIADLPVCDSRDRYLVSTSDITLELANCTVCPQMTTTNCDHKVEGANKVYG